MANQVSELFDAAIWREVPGFESATDITYHRHISLGMVRIAFNRPEVRNAFRPKTVDELAADARRAAGTAAAEGYGRVGGLGVRVNAYAGCLFTGTRWRESQRDDTGCVDGEALPGAVGGLTELGGIGPFEQDGLD